MLCGVKSKKLISKRLQFSDRLIFCRPSFMIINSLGHERQSAINGAVVNIPIPISNIVTSLPRAFYEAEVVQNITMISWPYH